MGEDEFCIDTIPCPPRSGGHPIYVGDDDEVDAFISGGATGG